MSKQLPERASLEHLKNEAKALKIQTGQRLAESQLQIARDYGFLSWAKLKRHVEGFPSRREAFFSAISAGDRALVEQILNEDPGLVRSHNPDSFGQVPISAAANREDRGMIDLLLSRGADIDARSDWWAGSFGALDFGSDEIAEYLISKGATLTAHAAARLGKVEELREIVKSNPESVRERGGDGQFPLHFARNAETVDILVDAGADPDARDIDHESTAAQWRIQNSDVLSQLVERGASTDIFMAVALDNPSLIASHLLADPASLTRKTNEPGNPMIRHQAPGSPIYVYELGFSRPLQVAANMGKDNAYSFLFDQSPPQAQLLAACWKGDLEKAHALKSHVKSLSKEDASQVADAARNRRHDLLALMLEIGFPVDSQDHEGMAPVHWASFHGDSDALNIILPYRPSLSLKNGYGGTALGTLGYGSIHGWYVKTGAHAECAQILIDAGAEVKAEMRGNDAVNAVLDSYRSR